MDGTSWFFLYLLTGTYITMLGYKGGDAVKATAAWDVIGILIWPLIFFVVFFGGVYKALKNRKK